MITNVERTLLFLSFKTWVCFKLILVQGQQFLNGFLQFFLHKVGVIEAVRNSLDTSSEVTALWVTHRLEELEYADGAIYMEDGKVVMHGDAPSIRSFIEGRQSDYIKKINSWIFPFWNCFNIL